MNLAHRDFGSQGRRAVRMLVPNVDFSRGIHFLLYLPSSIDMSDSPNLLDSPEILQMRSTSRDRLSPSRSSNCGSDGSKASLMLSGRLVRATTREKVVGVG